MNLKTLTLVIIGVFAVVISGCSAKSRFGMIEDNSGFQIGSYIESNLFIDADQFSDNRMKLSIRNTSGDNKISISDAESKLVSAYESKGFKSISSGKDYGLKMDINIRYSGAVERNMALELGLIGGIAGSAVGNRSDAEESGTLGAVAGASLGSIIGSYVKDNTYLVFADVTIGVKDRDAGTNKSQIIIGDNSIKNKSESGLNPYRQIIKTQVAVYAGGRNTRQSEIADIVRKRLLNILQDVI